MEPAPIAQLQYGSPAPSKDLRKVAIYQRNINLCILAYILLMVAAIAGPPQLRVVLSLIALIINVTGAVFLFMLAFQLYSTATGIVLGLLALVPLLGLIILLSVNGRATRMLRKHGIKVGLLGAKPAQIPSPGTNVLMP